MLKRFVAKLFGFDKEFRDIITDNYNLRCNIVVLEQKIKELSKVNGSSVVDAEKKPKAKKAK